MNLGRAFVKINWDIFVRDVGICLGFKSPRAQDYLQKVSDHHKMWPLLEIMYPALTLELITPYVKDCQTESTSPTCTGYWEWCKHVTNPNYMYMQYATLTHLHV